MLLAVVCYDCNSVCATLLQLLRIIFFGVERTRTVKYTFDRVM